jgi:ABC-type branched-subunit amino acid transport system permease subunit
LHTLLSLPALPLRGIYVALMTFGFGEVVRLLIIADGTGLTGGTFGLSGFAGFGFDSVDALTRDRLHYAITMDVAIMTGLAIFAIMRSPLGSGLVALRDNPTLAAARGIGPRVLQMVVFGVAGFFAGVAGAVYAFAFSVVAPTLMGLAPMTLLVTMLVVGGLGTVMGPVVGTVIMAFVQARLHSWPDARLIVLGLILLVMIVAVPAASSRSPGKYRRRLDDWIDAGDVDDPAMPPRGG